MKRFLLLWAISVACIAQGSILTTDKISDGAYYIVDGDIRGGMVYELDSDEYEIVPRPDGFDNHLELIEVNPYRFFSPLTLGNVFDPETLNPLQWLYRSSGTSTVEDRTTNTLDAVLVASPMLTLESGAGGGVTGSAFDDDLSGDFYFHWIGSAQRYTTGGHYSFIASTAGTDFGNGVSFYSYAGGAFGIGIYGQDGGSITDEIILGDANFSTGDILDIVVYRESGVVYYTAINMTTSYTNTGSVATSDDYTGSSTLKVATSTASQDLISDYIYMAFGLNESTLSHVWTFGENGGTVAYDKGLGDHITFTFGGGGEAVAWGGAQPYIHDAILNGYSLYEKASSRDIYVPYSVLGSPLSITAPAGYTKTADYPAIDWHNGAPTSVTQTNATVQANAFWSTNYITASNLYNHVNFYSNVVVCASSERRITDTLTWTNGYEWTEDAYDGIVSWLDSCGSTVSNLVPLTDTNGTYIIDTNGFLIFPAP